jgi:hypothetical protein
LNSFSRRTLLLPIACLALGFGARSTAADPNVRTVVVSPVDGDPLASGEALREAYNAVANGQYPVVLSLQPGTYDLEPAPLEVNRLHVDLEGSGRDVTTIAGSGFGVLQVNSDVKLSRLSIDNLHGQAGAAGVYAQNGLVKLQEVDIHVSRDSNDSLPEGLRFDLNASGWLTDVRVYVENPSGSAIGLDLLSSNSTAPSSSHVAPNVLENVTVKSSDVALQIGSTTSLKDMDIQGRVGVQIITSGDVKMVDSRIGAEFGLVGGGGSFGDPPSQLLVQRSSITALYSSLVFQDLPATYIVILDTMLSSAISVASPSKIRCVGAYDASFAPLDSACQPQQ